MAGYPPFYDEDQRKLFKKIKEGKYYFHEDYWANISPEAVDLIKHMLCVNQSERWTARQLLNHPWIVMADTQLQAKNLQGSIATLRKFTARRKLRAAADAIILLNRIKNMGVSASQRNSKKAAAQLLLEDVQKAAEEDAAGSVTLGEEISAPTAAFLDPNSPR